MSTENPSSPLTIESRRKWLATLLANQDTMLDELGQVVGIIAPERLRKAPETQLERVEKFIDTIDLQSATDDARIWLINRLGLYVARWFMARYGGYLAVQSNSHQRFFLHIVVTGMHSPVPSMARLDPFAIAYEIISTSPRPKLSMLIETAEQELMKPGKLE